MEKRPNITVHNLSRRNEDDSMFGQSSLDQGATKQKGKAKQQRSNALLAFLLFDFGCFFA